MPLFFQKLTSLEMKDAAQDLIIFYMSGRSKSQKSNFNLNRTFFYSIVKITDPKWGPSKNNTIPNPFYNLHQQYARGNSGKYIFVFADNITVVTKHKNQRNLEIDKFIKINYLA